MPDLYSCELGWYAVKAATKREHLAAEIVRKETQMEAFCPRISYMKRTRRGKVRFVEALFPGYLFVRTELKSTYRRVMAISGVTGMVRYGNRVPSIPDSFIAELRSHLRDETHEEPEADIRPGQTVTLIEGPFKDWSAVVSGAVPGKQRVALLLDFLGRVLEVEVPSDIVMTEDDEGAKYRTFGAQKE